MLLCQVGCKEGKWHAPGHAIVTNCTPCDAAKKKAADAGTVIPVGLGPESLYTCKKGDANFTDKMSDKDMDSRYQQCSVCAAAEKKASKAK
jgi:hypothetical protein